MPVHPCNLIEARIRSTLHAAGRRYARRGGRRYSRPQGAAGHVVRHELVDHVRVRDDGREAQLRSNVCGTRSGREDVVVVDEWVPLGLASQGLEQANQRIAEGAEALDDRRDELAAYTLRKRVVLVLLVLLLGGSGDAGGGRAAGGAGRRAILGIDRESQSKSTGFPDHRLGYTASRDVWDSYQQEHFENHAARGNLPDFK